jgi:hypothetical protein
MNEIEEALGDPKQVFRDLFAWAKTHPRSAKGNKVRWAEVLGTPRDKLDGMAANLIWQFVRFNEEYQIDWRKTMAQSQALAAVPAKLKKLGIEAGDIEFERAWWAPTELWKDFAIRWALYPTPQDPLENRIPTDHYFSKQVVFDLDDVDDLSEVMTVLPSQSPNEPLIFLTSTAGKSPKFPKASTPDQFIKIAISPLANEESIAAAVKKILKKKKKTSERLKVSSHAYSDLLEILYCGYFKHCEKLTPAKIRRELEAIFGKKLNLTNFQINQKSKRFQLLVDAAPWCFLLPPAEKRRI